MLSAEALEALEPLSEVAAGVQPNLLLLLLLWFAACVLGGKHRWSTPSGNHPAAENVDRCHLMFVSMTDQPSLCT
jgi:hypothetical protein